MGSYEFDLCYNRVQAIMIFRYPDYRGTSYVLESRPEGLRFGARVIETSGVVSNLVVVMQRVGFYRVRI